MKRFKADNVLTMQQDPDGAFVLFNEAIEAMQSAVGFALAHVDDIENDINDYGSLKPILDMVKAREVH